MRLTDVLKLEYIEVGIVANSKSELIEQMIDIICRNPKVHDKEDVRRAVYDREKVMTTGIGDQVAIPHGKSDGVDKMVVAFATTNDFVEFESLDGAPVKLVLMVMRRPSETAANLSLLSRASRIFKNETLRQSLFSARSRREIMDILRAEDDRLDRIS